MGLIIVERSHSSIRQPTRIWMQVPNEKHSARKSVP